MPKQAQMKTALAVACESKNGSMRRGGFSPSQWVTAKHPRRPGSLKEEDEWGQLGALAAQQDSATIFGLRAQYRFTAQKQLVQVDCGRRYAAAQLRKARTINRNYTVGNLVMHMCE